MTSTKKNTYMAPYETPKPPPSTDDSASGSSSVLVTESGRTAACAEGESPARFTARTYSISPVVALPAGAMLFAT